MAQESLGLAFKPNAGGWGESQQGHLDQSRCNLSAVRVRADGKSGWREQRQQGLGLERELPHPKARGSLGFE